MIDVHDVVGIDNSVCGDDDRPYAVILYSIDGDHTVPLATFSHASAAAVYCANVRSVVESWFGAAS